MIYLNNFFIKRNNGTITNIKEKLIQNTNIALGELKKPLTKESVDAIIQTFDELEDDSKKVINLLQNN